MATVARRLGKERQKWEDRYITYKEAGTLEGGA